MYKYHSYGRQNPMAVAKSWVGRDKFLRLVPATYWRRSKDDEVYLQAIKGSDSPQEAIN